MWAHWLFAPPAITTHLLFTLYSLCMGLCAWTYTLGFMWRLEDHLWKSVLFCHVGPRDGTQVIRVAANAYIL